LKRLVIASLLLLLVSGCIAPKTFHKTHFVRINLHVMDKSTFANNPITKQLELVKGRRVLGWSRRLNRTTFEIGISGTFRKEGIKVNTIVMGHEMEHVLHWADKDFIYPD